MVSKHFILEELVPPHIFMTRGDKAWELLDARLIETIDAIKTRFPEGTMTINNWKWKGNRLWSGLRTPESIYYSSTSQHSFGRAVDCVFSKYTTSEVRKYIIDHPEEFPHVKGIELAVSWLHIDVRNTTNGHIKKFKA